MGVEGYLVSPAVFKTVEGGGPALVSSILTCSRQTPRLRARLFFVLEPPDPIRNFSPDPWVDRSAFAVRGLQKGGRYGGCQG